MRRTYKSYKGIHIDSNLRDVSENILHFLKDNDVLFVSLKRNNVVEGRSWEMAAVHGVLGNRGVFTGTLHEYLPKDSAIFGGVPGVDVKRKLSNLLITDRKSVV